MNQQSMGQEGKDRSPDKLVKFKKLQPVRLENGKPIVMVEHNIEVINLKALTGITAAIYLN